MSVSDLLRQQNEEYEESLRRDILLEQEELQLQQQRMMKESNREEEELQQAIKASLSEEIETEIEKPLSPRTLREVRMRYFKQKEKCASNRGMRRKNGINESLILKSKLRSGKT